MGDLEYTIVVGLDHKHLVQLSWTIQTWRKQKPDLFDHPIVAFYDREDAKVVQEDIRRIIDHPGLTLVPWPLEPVRYEGEPGSKWTNPQRNKMLAGFVHVPAVFVDTPHWLKLDSDAIAMGTRNWINSEWFNDGSPFIGPPWSFTKPPDQMLVLDRWVEGNRGKVPDVWKHRPLDLHPEPGHGRLGHKRTVSWCAFFETEFTRMCAKAAHDTCGPLKIPVPSQDGFLWYMAERMGRPAKRVRMKNFGWKVRNNMNSIKQECGLSLGRPIDG